MHPPFQCSSASRKFLTERAAYRADALIIRFQCSSASRKFLTAFSDELLAIALTVSVLFSEPKIPHAETFLRRQLL